MKNLFLLFFVFQPLLAQAAFNRFWVGHKRADVSTEAFLAGLNKTFFRETIELSRGKGLLSYQPYVTKMTNDLPDELALVSYESEEKYRAIRNTPAGERYSALHWDYFDKDRSKSTVTEPFSGEFLENHAYELHPRFTSWQASRTVVIIYQREGNSDLKKLADSFHKLASDSAVNNSAILITDKLVFEYRSYKKRLSSHRLPMKILEGRPLRSEKDFQPKIPIAFEDGANFIF